MRVHRIPLTFDEIEERLGDHGFGELRWAERELRTAYEALSTLERFTIWVNRIVFGTTWWDIADDSDYVRWWRGTRTP